MSVSLTSPVTGAAQTGLTSPTYSMTADISPTQNSKQWAVTSLGGTRSGVSAHSVSSPFTIAFFRPQIIRGLSPVNPVTGRLGQVPVNTHKVITRKGVLPLAGQAPVIMEISTTIKIPAGADLADPTSVRAALSLHFGAVSQQSTGIGDTGVIGVL